MEMVRVKKNYQITLPKSLRKFLRLAVGDFLELEIKDETLVIRPVKLVHPGQEYFFTKEWQEKEAEADRDLAQGKVAGPFDNAEDSLKALKTTKV
ncbi:MAG: AbrB/MazE/SpoVT family DNA-binding domain-containing protein [Deltaproteobacteria bacterium]|nr:MAG: AbrB/MazE/SpoVT family DNA-binding domain-containing protein [Deltaproteobacteria bacterium]